MPLSGSDQRGRIIPMLPIPLTQSSYSLVMINTFLCKKIEHKQWGWTLAARRPATVYGEMAG